MSGSELSTRILPFTGKGGVGKTTVAAATALQCADTGLRTIVLSTDPAPSLADAFRVPLDSQVRRITGGVSGVGGSHGDLWGQQLATERLEERRSIVLPDSLRRRVVKGATMVAGRLEVTFAPVAGDDEERTLSEAVKEVR